MNKGAFPRDDKPRLEVGNTLNGEHLVTSCRIALLWRCLKFFCKSIDCQGVTRFTPTKSFRIEHDAVASPKGNGGSGPPLMFRPILRLEQIR